jgi:AAA+ ATPase superfamily predicted ATPase
VHTNWEHNERFLDRVRELAALEERWASGRAEALIMLGRRRVGKSKLIERFLQGKRTIYLVGTREAAQIHLADAARALHQATGDPLAAGGFASWSQLLTFVAQATAQERLAFVLDEFAYFCDASPELPSVVQRWWDREGSRTRIVTILAGSHVAFMEQSVLGGHALYGRRTGQFRIRPFDYFDAGRFFQTYTPADRIRAYAVFGGMAAYLDATDPNATIGENIARLMLGEHAYLRDEPAFLLAQERSVDRPAAYLSILRAIAAGRTQPSRIAQAAGFDSASDILRILERLQEFRLVERRVPVGTDPLHTRSSVYVLTDHLLRFWFTFLAPGAWALESGQRQWLLENEILPVLDQYVSRAHGAWEDACRAYLWRAWGTKRLRHRFTELGSWWQGRGQDEGVEIDALGLYEKKVVLAASCKWRNDYVTIGDLDALIAAAARAGANEETQYALFSRSGFDPKLVELARARDVLLVTPEEMFDPDLETKA